MIRKLIDRYKLHRERKRRIAIANRVWKEHLDEWEKRDLKITRDGTFCSDVSDLINSQTYRKSLEDLRKLKLWLQR